MQNIYVFAYIDIIFIYFTGQEPGQYALQYLVGATDMNHEGNWTWLDGTQVNGW